MGYYVAKNYVLYTEHILLLGKKNVGGYDGIGM